MIANPFSIIYLAEVPKIKFYMTAGWPERYSFLFQFCECYTSLVDEGSSGAILIVICAIF